MNAGEMPPEDKKQPTASEKTLFLDDLSHELVDARAILSDSGGLITMRRLNRREYENTIRTLLDVDVDTADLPDDTNSDGFDTAGASLFFSSDQFEQYVTIARRALHLASTGIRSESDLAVVGMGKVAGREFTYHSDLDLIFLYGAGSAGAGVWRP